MLRAPSAFNRISSVRSAKNGSRRLLVFSLLRGMNRFTPMFAAAFRRCRIVIVTAFAATCAHAAPSTNSLEVIYADPHALANAKSAYTAGDAALKPAFDRLFTEAGKALKSQPASVMDKKRVPPSGDKHDFISQAPYFWQETNSPDGKYVRHDGERNPESSDDFDAGRLGKMCSNVHTLAMAYYFSDKEEYAEHAAQLLRVWFLDSATRMNPNLNFGQGIPGQVDGRPMGIISTRAFVGVVDAIRLLRHSKSWSVADQKGMVAWMTQYLEWLQTNKLGIGEGEATNNHGTFYDTQVAALGAFVGKTDLAKKIVLDAREKRIAKQIDSDGKMPRELQRTKSFSYSTFNLRALMDLANLGQNLGIDLWHFQTEDGRSIRKALDFLAPYVKPDSKWPYQQIEKLDRRELASLLLRAAPQYPDAHYESLVKDSGIDLAASEDRLLFNTKTAAQ
jgi:hypothetical protein